MAIYITRTFLPSVNSDKPLPILQRKQGKVYAMFKEQRLINFSTFHAGHIIFNLALHIKQKTVSFLHPLKNQFLTSDRKGFSG